MAGRDGGDDSVYESVLARVERSELRDQLHTVARKECRSIHRRVRRASSSLTALRQLQAAAQHLQPSGDWQPTSLEKQLKSIEKLQKNLETAVDHLDVDITQKQRTKKRKRPRNKEERRTIEDQQDVVDQEEDRCVEGVERRGDIITGIGSELQSMEGDKSGVVAATQEAEEDSDVELLEVVPPGAKREEEGGGVNEKVESGVAKKVAEEVEDARRGQQQEGESDMESLEEVMASKERVEEDVAEGGMSTTLVESGDGILEPNADVEMSEFCELPRRLVRLSHDAIANIKEEPAMSFDEHTQEEDGYVDAAYDTGQSPLKLEVLESSKESAQELEVSDLEEVAIELEVPDSDADDNFSPCLELVTNLQEASAATQLVQFPAAVEQLRAFLLGRKHLVAAEVDGYLFAHKRITDEEVIEIGLAIETIISVAMELPTRPKIRLALYDLIAIVEQLELALGELPPFLQPIVKTFSSYFSAQMGENVDTNTPEPRFTVLCM